MIVSHLRELKTMKMDHPDAKEVLKKVLVSPAEGWEGYVMRVFDLGEGGHSPKHSHPWPHINYMIQGKGILHIDGKDYEVEEGSFAFVPPNKVHQFSNRGSETFTFICIVPEEGDK
ncbi:cupin domain-containing protein [Tepidibacillus infernus]|uniref:Cupin n=1 Tax=Tepidibacillus decaturensis TaxID=1413211 RepID=A0A135L3U9_9BACI|nr:MULTISPECIES: cupin domain-containing protein [Tepidibacillus]KXG43559.1 cupin [Tepidibacillus decaturensis]GBF12132.1 hypothetical protein HK1_02193 [Tepidibacillus sp. HK-1]